MGGNYEKGMYNQLMEVIVRLDTMESELHAEKKEHKEDVDQLNDRLDSLKHENLLLRDNNAISEASLIMTAPIHPCLLHQTRKVESLQIPITERQRLGIKQADKKVTKRLL